jgi:hypothetical protein
MKLSTNLRMDQVKAIREIANVFYYTQESILTCFVLTDCGDEVSEEINKMGVLLCNTQAAAVKVLDKLIKLHEEGKRDWRS